MKILQINCVFPLGSTGKVVNDIHNELIKNGYESIICYGNGPKIKGKHIYKNSNIFLQKANALISRITGYMYGGCFIATNKIIRIIKMEKPDVVHLHCLNGHIVNIYKLIEYLKKNDIKTILTLHAEFMYTANCGHAFECEKWKNGCEKCPNLKQATNSIFFDKTHQSWIKMYKAFENFKNLTVVSVSPWVMSRVKEAAILKNCNQKTILNGIDTNIFKYYNTTELKRKMNLENKKIILHVTPFFSTDIHHIKGGHYVLKLANMLKERNIQILIAGKHDSDLKVPENVILLGEVQDQEKLAMYYSMADFTLLTSKKETFSMVVAESLCCGTPIIGFKAGAPEQIAIPKYSVFVEYGNLNDLSIKLFNLELNKTHKEIIKKAHKKYSKESMANQYIELYREK